MADKRAFANFDVGYFDNPKIMDIFDASPNAVFMHIASVMYCAQHLTDGKVASKAMQRKIGGTEEDTRLLIDAELWHEPGHTCEFCPQPPAGKVYVHDYTEHNRTSDGVKDRSEAGKKGARARWGEAKTSDKGNANRMRIASEPQSDPECETDESAMARKKERKILKDLKDSMSDAASGTDAGKQYSPEVHELCDRLAGWIVRNGNRKPTVGDQWFQACDRLIRLDGISPDDVRGAIDWSQQNEFWRGNIMSMGKLREKYDQLRLAAQRPADGQPRTSTTQSRLQTGQTMVERLKAKEEQAEQAQQQELLQIGNLS